MPLEITVNGSPREVDGVDDGVRLAQLAHAMDLKVDRVAIERNGEIVPRRRWAEVKIAAGDKLEIVHFVGGGAAGWAGGHQTVAKNC